MAARIVTLTSDFGYNDAYVGVLKGVLISVYPEIQLLDVNHGVPPHDVFEAAWSVAQVSAQFPPGTIHLVAAEASSDRGLLVHAGGQFYVATDNGALSLIYARHPGVDCVVRHITALHYARPQGGATFLARDLLAPVAAWLARGVDPEKFGEIVQDYRRFTVPQPRLEGNVVHAVVLRVDRFGNLVTNVLPSSLPPEWTTDGRTRLRVQLGSTAIDGVFTSYTDGPGQGPFALWGADGWLEISAQRASAARLTSAQRGSTLSLTAAGD